MAIRERLSGNEAVSTAIRQINPDVMPAFPITPSTEIPQYVSSYVADGLIDTEFVAVESEHSAMSATIGASAAGARALTATSSAGLALMWEELHIASSDRVPVVLALVNRALSGPININADHSDGMGARDCGWIQLYSEDNQEAYDNMVMAFRIAEHPDVLLPVMVCQDGFITSHAVQNLLLLEDEKVKNFVGEYEPEDYLLNAKNPMAVGPYAVSSYYMEARRSMAQGMLNAKKVIMDVAKEYENLSGRGYNYFEEYQTKDADYVIVVMGSATGAAKDACDKLRAQGKKVGVLKIRVFRPFPAEELAAALKNVKAIAAMDRAESFSGNGGPMAAELKAALFGARQYPEVLSMVYGLGGRDITVEDMEMIYADLEAGNFDCKELPYRYVNVRE
ncbi:MAG: pyruvate ferredoxin oxidoreductase [Eubacteriales bacterium]|jgi:pyruvate ferredoxin oxidoreductase alpha subunit|nr:pyruvate ferredoxin oxidoreductase [Eubacteriales bacterium]MDD3289590.1 pyruvate ferredoxin oxidoreductase [Eubacteriales bacterium]MDD3864649.1 pyruvate ferredoxin oxidoreductase [Eubacteriales bacterium]MDD4444283.1 pyruvate ferredoxin oxidoreductase [Eubacteriales bacterium]